MNLQKIILLLSMMILISCTSTNEVKLNPTSIQESEKQKIINNPMALYYIKKPSIDLQLLALSTITPKNLAAFLVNSRVRKKFTMDSEAIQLKMLEKIINTLNGGYDSYKYNLGALSSVFRDVLSETTSEKAQLFAVQKNGGYFSSIKNPTTKVKNHPNVLTYQKQQQVAKLKRDRKREEEDAEYSKRMNNYSNSSSSSSSSYNQPTAPACRNERYTQYLPGTNRTVQNTRRVCN